ncbi:glycosyl transferase family protein [compost metagenome]
MADARRNSRIDWLHEGHQQTLIDPVGGSLAEVPELPPGSDVDQTVAWIRRVLDGAVAVPAPIATQIEAIRECLRQGTRVTWASPV